MTKQELSMAVDIATSGKAIGFDLVSIFDGFGLPDFKPVTVTIMALAQLVKWQCLCLDGSIDQDALTEIMICGRRRFNIVGRTQLVVKGV